MLCREFDARARGFASRSADNYFERSAETHAIADQEHRTGRSKIGPGYSRRCCADVFRWLLHFTKPQSRKSVFGAKDQESNASSPQFVITCISPSRGCPTVHGALECFWGSIRKSAYAVLGFANIICPK